MASNVIILRTYYAFTRLTACRAGWEEVTEFIYS